MTHEPLDAVQWPLPWILTRLDELAEWHTPQGYVGGYGYDLGDQPIVLEVWTRRRR